MSLVCLLFMGQVKQMWQCICSPPCTPQRPPWVPPGLPSPQRGRPSPWQSPSAPPQSPPGPPWSPDQVQPIKWQYDYHMMQCGWLCSYFAVLGHISLLLFFLFSLSFFNFRFPDFSFFLFFFFTLHFFLFRKNFSGIDVIIFQLTSYFEIDKIYNRLVY